MPPKDEMEMVASPEPQTALIRRNAYCTATGFPTTIGATTGPPPVLVTAGAFGAGVFGAASGALVLGLAGGGGGGSLRYLSVKSERISCFSEILAFN